MTVEKLDKAIAECKRFMDAANEAKKHTQVLGGKTYLTSGRDNGSANRASLDLSRALSDLRRNDRA